jgi:hypothetical protein
VTGTNREVEAVVAASLARTAASSFSRYNSADSGILSRTRKFFFKNAFRRKGYPFSGQKPFLDRFLGEGA